MPMMEYFNISYYVTVGVTFFFAHFEKINFFAIKNKVNNKF